MGVQPEPIIRAFIDRNRPRKSDRVLAEAATLHDNGDTEAAIALLAESEQADPDNDRTRLILATLYIDEEEFNDAHEALRRVGAQTKLEPEYGAISTRLDFAELSTTVTAPDQLQQVINQDPDDCESRLRLSAWALLNDEAELGLENLLEIVKRDRSFRDDAGRRYLLSAFAILGSHPKLVSKYRGLLARRLN
jgi:putative thioredoxin